MTAEFPNLCALHRATSARLGPLPALRFKRDGLWHQLSWDDYRREADRAAAGLAALGVQPGDRVALLSENRFEWLVADHAILSTGAVSVPIHAPSSPAQVRYQLDHSGARGVIVSGAQAAKVAAVARDVPELQFVVGFDAAPEVPALKTFSWDGLRHAGRRTRPEIPRAESALDGESLATLIYTSGTTGQPKGVMLTHGNLLSNSLAAAHCFGFGCADTFLNWLPFSHVYARCVDHYSTTWMGMTLALAESALTVPQNLREVQPTCFTSVPRLLEKIWAQLAALSPEQRTAAARKTFGARLVQISTGGAPLPVHVAEGLRDAGVSALEGYGLTETSPIIAFNWRGAWKIGTVGKVIPGVEVRLAPDGEILTRGPHVMRGYWRDAEATALALPDGWLRTGDLGALDADGYLAITGRKKEIIVTAGGKNIAPAVLEALLIRDPFIEQAVVHGDARAFVSAVIVPKAERLAQAVRDSGGALPAEGDIVSDARLVAWFQKRVDAALAEVSQPERVKKIVLLARSLTADREELTITQKVRRAVVFAHCRAALEALYSEASA